MIICKFHFLYIYRLYFLTYFCHSATNKMLFHIVYMQSHNYKDHHRPFYIKGEAFVLKVFTCGGLTRFLEQRRRYKASQKVYCVLKTNFPYIRLLMEHKLSDKSITSRSYRLHELMSIKGEQLILDFFVSKLGQNP